MSLSDELERRAQDFAQRHGLVLGARLGSGVHGIVYASESQPVSGAAPTTSAVKVHRHVPDFLRERDIYLRLKERGVRAIRGCRVPELLRYDDDSLILEMTIVTRPFVLDFGGAFLDKSPDFSEEVMADWHAEKREQFGRHWPEVQAILCQLECMGIYMIDVHPSNISFDFPTGAS
jgi:hypothetical protein